MFSHDDDQEEMIIGEAALNLIRAEQEVNQVSLLRELVLMANKASSVVRGEEIKRAINLFKSLSSNHNHDETVLTWMMASFPDDDGKHH
ncbi:hypothetical protein [Tatumella ptyseos]|uniref:hypothetical protein n=1 Tax=Tatumella ptyseos TaxID=82987 RepID=UPI0026EE5224|nr:hypothetical protein [Tatumella ptyseos]WKX25584.1 hypothetical protein QJR74_09620 [Tatumella ptyseos]